MDLLSNLNTQQWKGASPNEVKGMKAYLIVRSKMLQKGKWEITCREDTEEGSLQNTVLDGCSGKSNPLQSVRNVELKLDGDNIVAINLNDDCVARK